MADLTFWAAVFVALVFLSVVVWVRWRDWHRESAWQRAVREFEERLRLGPAESASALEKAARHFLLVETVSKEVHERSEILSRDWELSGRPRENHQDNLGRVMDFLKGDVFSCARTPSLGIEALFAGFLGADLAKLADDRAAELKWKVAQELVLSLVPGGARAWVEIRHPEWVNEIKQWSREILEWIAGKMGKDPGELLDGYTASVEHQISEVEASLNLTEGVSIETLGPGLSGTFEQISGESFAPLWEGLRSPPTGAQVPEIPADGVGGAVSGAADDVLKQAFAGSADDLARAFGDDVVTIADDALRAGDDLILSGADDAMGSLVSGALAKIPVLTIIHSSWREASLLSNQQTDWESALGNLALDATGVGVGAWIGGAVGSVVPGWGTAVGAAIGGWLGKQGTDKIKRLDLEQAVERYQSLSRTAAEKQRAASKRLFHRVQRASGKHRGKRQQINREYPDPKVWQALMTPLATRVVGELARHLQRLSREDILERTKREYLEQLPEDPWWVRCLGFETRQDRIAAVAVRCSELQAGLNDLRTSVPDRVSLHRRPVRALEWVGQAMNGVPFGGRQSGWAGLVELVDSCAELQMTILLVWVRKVTSTHYLSAAHILLEGQRGAEKYRGDVSPAVQAALRAGDRVDLELRKLGKARK